MHAAHVTNAKLINLSMPRKNMRTIGLAYRIIVLTTGVLLNSVPEKRNFFWQRKRCFFSYWRHIGYWIWMHLNKKTFFLQNCVNQNNVVSKCTINIVGKFNECHWKTNQKPCNYSYSSIQKQIQSFWSNCFKVFMK